MSAAEASTGAGAVPEVSVVIPTHGRARRIGRTLDAVLGDAATTEVVVVIDGDDPDTDEALRWYTEQDSRVRVIHADGGTAERLGEQRVRDHGASAARSDLILALDDDIIAAPGLVSGHARRHAAQSDLVVLGYMPLAEPQPGRRWSAATRLYAESYERECERFDADPGSILLGLWGGNFSVRREHWVRALAMEPVRMDFMHTDREFGLRLHRLGLRGVFDRTLRSVHEDERDVRRLADGARASAVAYVRLGHAYPDLLPPGRTAARRCARPLTTGLVALSRPPRVWRALLELLIRVTGFAQRRGVVAVEYALTRLIWRLAYEREHTKAR